MTDDELLSRWCSGDLDPESAAVFEARLRDEPVLQARLETLEAWLSKISELPESAPPPELNAKVLSTPPREATTPREVPTRDIPQRPYRFAGAAGLAAAALWWLGSPQSVTVTLQGDTLTVQGSGWVAVDGVGVELDGHARWTRTPTHEEQSELRIELLGGQGVARVPDGATALAKGDVQTVAIPRGHDTPRAAPDISSTAPATSTRPSPAFDQADAEATIRSLQARIAELEESLATSDIQGAVARGQLGAATGLLSPWPTDLPRALEPGVFSDRIYEAASRRDDLVVEGIDCDEYPCIALLRVDTEREQDARRLVDDVVAAAMVKVPSGASSVYSNHFLGLRGEVTLVGLAVAPARDLDRDGDVGLRTHYRTSVLTTDLARELVGR